MNIFKISNISQRETKLFFITTGREARLQQADPVVLPQRPGQVVRPDAGDFPSSGGSHRQDCALGRGLLLHLPLVLRYRLHSLHDDYLSW